MRIYLGSSTASIGIRTFALVLIAVAVMTILVACASGQSETSRDSGECDPAYPTVCIPPPPPDLDCGEITFRRFKVLPPDPHGFDGDKDGIGCER